MNGRRVRGGSVRARRFRGERGVALVEFALVFPIFLTVVLGLFSGGQSYSRKLALSSAASEAARYGATLAPTSFTGPPWPAGTGHGLDVWLREVAKAVAKNAGGNLDASVVGRVICVAYVHPIIPHPTTPDLFDDEGHGYELIATSGGDIENATHGPAAKCFDDGRPDTERRVQVKVSRPSDIHGLFFKYDLTLSARAVVRFEALA